MLIMAIDPNSKTGIAEGEPGRTPALSLVRFREDRDDSVEMIFGRVTYWFADRLRSNLPDVVFIEAPVPPMSMQGATNFATTRVTLGVDAIIAGIMKCKGIDVRRAQISSWRKAVLGNGRLNRIEAKRGAVDLCRRMKWEAEDDNVAEAACIWLYGCQQAAPYDVTTLRPALFAEARQA